MKTYLVDTEFIRASKERVHFIEIAMLDIEADMLHDYHMPPRLNSWEKKYFSRGLAGYYGTRTTKVFEAVNDLITGNFNKRDISDLCTSETVYYQFQKKQDVKSIEPLLTSARLLAWDTSNDRELLKQIKGESIELIDVQTKWIKKFGGRQLGLSDAFKHVLFNLNIKDENGLIESAHFACVDVLMLKSVYKFILEFDDDIKSIPIHYSIRDEQIKKNEMHIEQWVETIKKLELAMIDCVEEDMLSKYSKKIIKCKQKIAATKKRNEQLLTQNVYSKQWW